MTSPLLALGLLIQGIIYMDELRIYIAELMSFVRLI